MVLSDLMKRLANSDPQARYAIVFLYEAFNEQQKQLDMLTNVAAMQAEQFGQLMELLKRKEEAQAINETVRELRDFGKTPGVDVSSVAPDPNKGE